jgi:hypothetical protein
MEHHRAACARGSGPAVSTPLIAIRERFLSSVTVCFFCILPFSFCRFGSGLIPDFTNVGKAVRMAMTYYGNAKQRDQEFYAPSKSLDLHESYDCDLLSQPPVFVGRRGLMCAHILLPGKCENKWQELLLADDARNRAAGRPIKKDPSSAERAAEIADKIRDERKSEIRILLAKIVAEATQVRALPGKPWNVLIPCVVLANEFQTWERTNIPTKKGMSHIMPRSLAGRQGHSDGQLSGPSHLGEICRGI